MKKLLSCLMAVVMTLTLLAGCSYSSGSPGGKKPDGTFTLMVYMVGSDLESGDMAASNDIVEMLESGLNTENVNLVLFTGGSEMWHYNIPADKNAMMIMGADGDGDMEMLPVSETDKLKNMGEADTLSGFLNDACSAYPADHYGLICWDHGCGPLVGFGSDTMFDNDSLDPGELHTAFENSPFKDGKKLSFIGFDACLMSSMEIANTLSDHADYMIASQEKEPGDGWDYSFLSVMNETFDVPEIAEKIIASYHGYYEQLRSKTFNPDLTLACMDLSKAEGVNSAMNDLFGAMGSTLDGGDYYNRAIERSRVRSFGDASFSNRGMSLDLVDVGCLADECANAFSTESAALKTALSDFIVTNRSNLTDAAGVSLYYPYYGTKLYEMLGSESYQSYSKSPQYNAYMESFIRSWSQDWMQNEEADSYEIATQPEKSDDDLVFKLTDDQKRTFSKAYLNIFYKEPELEGEYYDLVLLGKSIAPDENGNILIRHNEEVPVFNDYQLFPLIQRSHKDDTTGYETISVTVNYRTADPSGKIGKVSCTVEDGYEEIEINSISFTDNNDSENVRSRAADGKNTIDANRWECLSIANLTMKPVRNDSGDLLPVNQWQSNIGNYFNYRLNEDNELSMQPIDELFGKTADDFYYQVVIEDAGGNQSWSELQQFPSLKKPTEFVRKTSLGQYTYELNDSYATLIQYEGRDKELIIPEKIEGVPVRYIALNAFGDEERACLTIENPDIELRRTNLRCFRKIILPEGLESIPPYAFYNCDKLDELVIPDTVTSIGTGAFEGSRMNKLELPEELDELGCGVFLRAEIRDGVTFKGENENFEIRDNLLLGDDGKTLLAVFPSSNTELVIPDGVEEIAPHVHEGSLSDDARPALTRITFPDSLKRIRYCAFDDEAFEELIFPDGLEEIGHFAFYNYEGFVSDVHTVNKICFGRKLSWIGYSILGDGRYGTLEISEKNRYYAVVNNRLTNRRGDADLMEEAALSQNDNISNNRIEYEAYLVVTDGLDTGLYDPEKPEDNKESDGNPYSTTLSIKDKKKSYFPGSTISLNGKEITLPCKLDALTDAGLKPENEDKLKEKVDYVGYLFLFDDQGNRLTAQVTTQGKNGILLKDCLVDHLAMEHTWGSDDVQVKIDFNYRGVTNQSSIRDVYDCLGNPSEIRLSKLSDTCVSIYLDYNSYNDYSDSAYSGGEDFYPKDRFELNYYYYPDTKALIMSDVELEPDTD